VAIPQASASRSRRTPAASRRSSRSVAQTSNPPWPNRARVLRGWPIAILGSGAFWSSKKSGSGGPVLITDNYFLPRCSSNSANASAGRPPGWKLAKIVIRSADGTPLAVAVRAPRDLPCRPGAVGTHPKRNVPRAGCVSLSLGQDPGVGGDHAAVVSPSISMCWHEVDGSCGRG
jgi:hypothetical protein